VTLFVQKVILIPIGHRNSTHFICLFSTDTLIIDAISQRTAAEIPERAVSLPVMPYGAVPTVLHMLVHSTVEGEQSRISGWE
jgi:creatinine amidohydrolase/Fe(II)-dependent formamide hydrolase-like protein